MIAIEQNLFRQANKDYRQGEYSRAIDRYQQLYIQQPSFEPYAVNLSMALRRLSNTDDYSQRLNQIYTAHNDLPLDIAKELISLTKLFDVQWYEKQYKDWLPAQLDPILHYLSLGWRLGFSPGPAISANYCKDQSLRLDEIEKCPLLHYLSEKKYKNIENNTSSWLSEQLWGGHSELALQQLDILSKNTTESTKDKRWWALWHQARWFYFIGDFSNALVLAKQMQQLEYGSADRKEGIYLKYFCLYLLGNKAEAYVDLGRYLKIYPYDTDALLAWSNSAPIDAERLAIINQAFSVAKLVGIELKDPEQPLTLNNIKGQPVAQVAGQYKVSIIMPIYKAAEQVQVAIESLLAQSYSNIEIIAVDDCSPDHTFEVLLSLAKKDPRVKAVRVPQNGGAYAARNYGLDLVSGDFITTHDSDDWSHPQKIATQVAYLQEHPKVMGCATHWIRADSDLCFTQNWRPGGCLTHWSHSSFMFRKEVVTAIGKWDVVRIGGDTEYIWRMQARFGQNSFAKIVDTIPLSFALDEESSLTRTKSTHVRTVYFGLRHIYREIAAWWQRYQPASLPLALSTTRPFKVPKAMVSNDLKPLGYDKVIAGDFSQLADTLQAARLIEQSIGQRIALFHWPSFGRAAHPLCNLYFELLLNSKVDPIVTGQRIQATWYELVNGGLQNQRLDGYPEWVGFTQWIVVEKG